MYGSDADVLSQAAHEIGYNSCNSCEQGVDLEASSIGNYGYHEQHYIPFILDSSWVTNFNNRQSHVHDTVDGERDVIQFPFTTETLAVPPDSDSQVSFTCQQSTHLDNEIRVPAMMSARNLSPSTGFVSNQASPAGHTSGLLTKTVGYYNAPSVDGHVEATHNANENDDFATFGSSSDISIKCSSGLEIGRSASAQDSSSPPMIALQIPQSESHLLPLSLDIMSSPAAKVETLRHSLTSHCELPRRWPTSVATSATPRVSSQTQSTYGQPCYSPAPTNVSAKEEDIRSPATFPQLANPIFCVDNYSRNQSPQPSVVRRSSSKRGRGEDYNAYLSPQPPDYSVDYVSDGQSTLDVHKSVPAESLAGTQRSEDGAWLVSHHTGQAGVNPGSREKMKGIYVSSPNELESERHTEETKAHVREWLTRNNFNSDDGQATDTAYSQHPFARPRAKSTSDTYTCRTNCMNLHMSDHHVPLSGALKIPHRDVPPPVRSTLDEEPIEKHSSDREQANSPVVDNPAVLAEEVENVYHPLLPEEILYSNISNHAAPWSDTPFTWRECNSNYQPPCSNDAIVQFCQRAKDIETASLAATMGSRRMSDCDVASLYAVSGVTSIVSDRLGKREKKNKGERRGSFLGSILPKRSNSNLLKRKNNHAIHQQQHPNEGDSYAHSQQPSPNQDTIPKRIGGWARSKSPALNTKFASDMPDVSSRTAVTPSIASSVSSTVSSSVWLQAGNVIRRNRSRSDVGKAFGLAELMTQFGGPPLLALTTPTSELKRTPSIDGDDIEDHDSVEDTVSADLTVRYDPITPTEEGFTHQIRGLNPQLADGLVERMTREQMRRYHRLLDLRYQHAPCVSAQIQSSGSCCETSRGAPKTTLPKPGKQTSVAPPVCFQIVAPGFSRGDPAALQDGTMVIAQFPSGIPLPPVQSLPAEFECPFCFKVKNFSKPSDWTKHVHEDVQPFTCTFPECEELKSFKRKADWVRHENERHRQLEMWRCDVGECSHVCFRRDNFVQHLVREHKVPEAKLRTGRAASGSSGPTVVLPEHSQDSGELSDVCSAIGEDGSKDVWARIHNCRQEATKHANDEPCRFCGRIFDSWKKLTVHVAKHMEQISLPVVQLVGATPVNTHPATNPADVAEYLGNSSTSLLQPSTSLPTTWESEAPLHNNATHDFFESDNNSTFSQLPNDSVMRVTAAQVICSHPPLQALTYRPQPQSLPTQYGGSASMHSTYATRSTSSLGLLQRQYAPAGNGLDMSSTRYLLVHSGHFPSPAPSGSTYNQQQVFSSPADGEPLLQDAIPPNHLPYSGYTL